MVTKTTQTSKSRTRLIVTAGKARAGKSTLCHLLQDRAEKDGWHCQRFSFADPLKSIVRMVQQDYVNKNPTALQATADHWKSLYGTSCFARDLVARLNAYQDTLPTSIGNVAIFVDDLRYNVEVEALQAWAGLGRDLSLIRVTRANMPEPDRDTQHHSEIDLDNVAFEHYRVEAANMDDLMQDAEELWKYINA